MRRRLLRADLVSAEAAIDAARGANVPPEFLRQTENGYPTVPFK